MARSKEAQKEFGEFAGANLFAKVDTIRPKPSRDQSSGESPATIRPSSDRWRGFLSSCQNCFCDRELGLIMIKQVGGMPPTGDILPGISSHFPCGEHIRSHGCACDGKSIENGEHVFNFRNDRNLRTPANSGTGAVDCRALFQ